MSENVQEKQKSSKLVIILLIVLIVLILAGIVTAIVLFGKQNNDDSSAEGEPAVTIGYEGNGVVALDEGEFVKTMEEMIRQAEEGMVDLRYKNTAESDDGVNFICYIGNSENNIHDMYFNIYLNDDFEQQILLTGLVPPGAMIETFESEIPLDPGEYSATLVFSQVGEDHASMLGQVLVTITLVVNG